jgi:hypothetical protein
MEKRELRLDASGREMNPSGSPFRRFSLYRFAILSSLFLVLSTCLFAQLPKNKMFHVDLAGVAFHELRCSYEFRLKDGWFGYVAPNGYYHDARKVQQQYAGLGVRLALRKYVVFKKKGKLPPDKLPPVGLYLQAGPAYRYMHLSYVNDNLDIGDKTHFHQAGLFGAIGKQWTWGAWNNDLCFGAMVGMEYLLHFFPSGYTYDDTFENWYQFPFSWKPQFLNGFRLYAGIEVGFALREKHRHW